MKFMAKAWSFHRLLLCRSAVVGAALRKSNKYLPICPVSSFGSHFSRLLFSTIYSIHYASRNKRCAFLERAFAGNESAINSGHLQTDGLVDCIPTGHHLNRALGQIGAKKMWNSANRCGEC
jgi:hypothetical protein